MAVRTSQEPVVVRAADAPVGPVVHDGRTAADLEAEISAHPHGRVPRELRFRHVVLVATELFVAHGFAGTSMDDIAERAGVSKPVVYDLVGSKEQLFAEVMTRAADELATRVAAAVDATDDDDRKLYAGALAFFRFVEERRAAWSSLLSADAGPVSLAVAHLRQRQAASVAGLLGANARAAGVAVDEVILEGFAHAVNGASEALAAWWQEQPSLRAEDLAALVTLLVGPGMASIEARVGGAVGRDDIEHAGGRRGAKDS